MYYYNTFSNHKHYCGLKSTPWLTFHNNVIFFGLPISLVIYNFSLGRGGDMYGYCYS